MYNKGVDKVILHCDLNNFYASVEQLSHPEFDGLPIAVSGNPEVRHGIVLAKNMLAKNAGVTTGEPLWSARRKCPDIVFLPPHFEDYVRISKEVFAIYTEFTDRVESFGLDECWLDVTASVRLLGDGKTIADVLRMTVDEAIDFFEGIPGVLAHLHLLRDVGLGYLSLGQQSSTLSGGEAQRIKLVTELARCAQRPGLRPIPTLYVLDEPTVGLHASDVVRLLSVLHRLVDAGHTVVIIEHNTDVMLDADCLIDLGPEGGSGGGTVVAQGPVPDLLASPETAARSHTVACLREQSGYAAAPVRKRFAKVAEAGAASPA